jgi:hypothetical protein
MPRRPTKSRLSGSPFEAVGRKPSLDKARDSELPTTNAGAAAALSPSGFTAEQLTRWIASAEDELKRSIFKEPVLEAIKEMHAELSQIALALRIQQQAPPFAD